MIAGARGSSCCDASILKWDGCAACNPVHRSYMDPTCSDLGVTVNHFPLITARGPRMSALGLMLARLNEAGRFPSELAGTASTSSCCSPDRLLTNSSEPLSVTQPPLGFAFCDFCHRLQAH